MAFCTNCGIRMDDNVAFCPICGTANGAGDLEKEKAGCCWTCLSFSFPFVGFILWLAWREHQPLKASGVCTAAWAGFAISLFLNVVFMILGAV